MTQAATVEAPAPADTDDAFDVDHWYCCNPNIAYCGRDISGDPEGHRDTNLCLLCVLVEEKHIPCPECGGPR